MWKFGPSLEERLASCSAQAEHLRNIMNASEKVSTYFVDKYLELRGKEAALEQRIREQSKNATLRKGN